MKLSVVTTLYKSSDHIEEFYLRITKEVTKLTDDYEIIFVDDGSPDDSLQKCIKLHKQDSKIKILELSRNFGHHKAIMTGLSNAQGDYIFLIDCDLEERPELLESFWQFLQKDKEVDVVYGVQEKRKGGWFERLSGALYYKIFNLLADDGKTPNNVLTVRLMKKSYVDQILLFNEKDFFFAHICELTGFNQQSMIVEKLNTSSTSYTFFRKYNLLINSIFTFSVKPLYFIFYFGLLITIISFVYSANLIINKIFFKIDIEGWTSIVASIWVIGGILTSFLGIVSIYISKIFIETKNRPFSIIKKIYGSNSK
jgi:putative glycosyltransferase